MTFTTLFKGWFGDSPDLVNKVDLGPAPAPAPVFKYRVFMKSGVVLSVASDQPWFMFLKNIRSDGYLICNSVYVPIDNIGHIDIQPIEGQNQDNVVQLRPVP